MQKNTFIKSFSILIASSVIIVLIAMPFLKGQINNSIFNLNLAKNREQAERLATLISIDLEKGEKADKVLQKVQNMLENTPQSKEHFACIVQDKNKVIAHPKPSNVGKNVEGWTLNNGVEEKTFTQAAGEGIPFGGIQTRLDGSQDISYQVPISTKPWAVCVHTKLDLVNQQAMIILKNIIWSLAAILFIIALISSLLIGKNSKSPEENM